MKRNQGNHPCFVFPEIKTTRTLKEMVLKVVDELKEYDEVTDVNKKDEEVVDVYHAVETLLRYHFKGREFRLNGVIEEVYRKNKNRGYYDNECF